MSKTVIDVLQETAAQYGDSPALVAKRGGEWTARTWQDYRDEVFRAAAGLVALGVEVGDGVAIMGDNCPEWFIADVAAIAAGGIPTGIYTTNTTEQSTYITEHCGASVAVLEDASYLGKLDRHRLPKLQHVVLMQGSAEAGALSWNDLLAAGGAEEQAELEARIAALEADDVCTLIYTSGTTGHPKGVMLSHTNLAWTSALVVDRYGIVNGESVVSYLPLSHIAEQVVSLHGPMARGCTTWFAESVEKLPEALRAARPHIFLGVPRVWEKIQAKMQALGAEASPLKQRIGAWAKGVGLRGGYADQRGEKRPWNYGLADRLVFSKVRQGLGLDRARVCVTSAAPIGLDTLEYFLSLGIPVLEIYGMSECSGPATFSYPDDYRTGAAGRALPGGEIAIADDGEILIRGPHVFQGYYRNEEATQATLDADGWLHSGDIGALDPDGFLRVTDRKKELLITAGGKNVAPQPLEARLKGIRGIAQAVVVGDRKKYIASLLVVDEESLAKLTVEIGSSASDADEATRCPRFLEHVQKGVDALNLELAQYESIKRFELLAEPLTVESAELTPTMKLKRRVIEERRAVAIGRLYS